MEKKKKSSRGGGWAELMRDAEEGLFVCVVVQALKKNTASA